MLLVMWAVITACLVRVLSTLVEPFDAKQQDVTSLAYTSRAVIATNAFGAD
jgi:hypothetical protein